MLLECFREVYEEVFNCYLMIACFIFFNYLRFYFERNSAKEFNFVSIESPVTTAVLNVVIIVFAEEMQPGGKFHYIDSSSIFFVVLSPGQ